LIVYPTKRYQSKQIVIQYRSKWDRKTGMDRMAGNQTQKPPSDEVSGGDRLSHIVAHAVPSALESVRNETGGAVVSKYSKQKTHTRRNAR
jgi:hypothetical protein